MRASVLEQAKAAWNDFDVEDQLSRCAIEKPCTDLRQSTLDSARSAWLTPMPMYALRPWLIATAAVFAFALCGVKYDSYQRSFHRNGLRDGSVATTTNAADTALLAALDLDADSRFLIAARLRYHDDSQGRAITLRQVSERLQEY